ncbi:N-acetyltransferase ESCO1 [Euwallacea fornicatus]|uniref:N-acetyltransferase ESCO1 n=1 Tax=Euwallacea fornicatus TaxID=995702 RepID=UPI0033903897
MATVRRSTLGQVRSPYISERRRQLFPSDNDDSDLGHISPLQLDTEPKTPTSTYIPSESMSPLILSPYINNTPVKFSPSHNYKTPHDTSTKAVLEKQQKALTEESKSFTRRFLESPKAEPKVSKVRTALFADTDNSMALSTKSFYSKELGDDALQTLLHRENRGRLNVAKSHASKQGGGRRERRLGQINNGVRHNIRKPKTRKTVLKSVPKLQDSDFLNEYIQDLTQLKKENRESKKKLIRQPKMSKEEETIRFLEESRPKKKQIKTFQEENKENGGPTEKANSNTVEEGSYKNLTNVEACQLDLSSDFEEETLENSLKIDGILNLLSSPTKEEEPRHEADLRVAFNESVIQEPNQIQSHDSITKEAGPRVTFSNALMHHISSHQRKKEAEPHSLLNQSGQIHVSDSILSPISQMCDVTSGLALDSPNNSKRAAPLGCSARVSRMLSFNEHCSTDMAQQRKLFPVFCKEQARSGIGEKRPGDEISPKKGAKRFRALAPNQLLLDAGQKRFGLTLCTECNLWYHMGDPNDEHHHEKHHESRQVLKFCGWKNERIVVDLREEHKRIIKVIPTDSKIWLNKVNELLELVNRELGCYSMVYDISESQVYIYVNNRAIAGCAITTPPKERGHRMLSTLSGVAMCSEESYPIKCVVSYIWVAPKFRKQGVASALLDAVKKNFLFGEVLTNDDLALTSPTEQGSAFAEKYFKTPNYLICSS